MKDCETCAYKRHKDELVCCAANELHNALNKLFKGIPVLGKYVETYKCLGYEDERLYGEWDNVDID